MTRPGIVITSRDQATPATPPTDTGTWFVVGLAEKGSLEPVLVTSMQAFERHFGGRVAYSYLYDSLELFFRRGGTRAWVRRVVGPSAARASVTLKDSEGDDALIVSAKHVGAYGNDLAVAVEAGSEAGQFVLVIEDSDGNVLERSPDLDDLAAAVAWSEFSEHVDVTLEGTSSNDPATTTAQALTGGDDDRTSITDEHRIAALASFSRELGPGQVSVPGATTADIYEALLTHADERNRRAILDAPDTSSKSTLKASATSIRALGPLARVGALFHRWVRIPGLALGTSRVVPPSAAVAGRIAAVDAKGNPNVPAAGEEGILAPDVIGFTQPEPTDDDVAELTEAGVNCLRTVYGQPRIYGFRTVAEKDTNPLHWQFANVRTDMAVAARCGAVAERFVHKQIDGKGLTIAQFAGELTAVLAEFHRVGALYGDTFDEAARVDVGPSVNTPETIENGELRAVLAIRRSPMAELVVVEIVRVRTTEAV